MTASGRGANNVWGTGLVDVDDAFVTVDGNHELAGKALRFELEVIEVRAATVDEIAHGHAHGPEGCSH